MLGRVRRYARFLLVVAALATGACGGETQEGVRLVADADAGFFDYPYPEDTRPAAVADLARFPNPTNRRALAEYLERIAAAWPGFGTTGAIYLRFAPAPERAELPDPTATTATTSRILLVDVDPRSPEYGRRFPLELRWFPHGTAFLPSGTLAVLPVPGFVLRPATRYAVLVYDGFAGWHLEPTPWWVEREAVLAEAETTGVVPPGARAGAVFTTQDPVGELARLADRIERELTPPRLEAWWSAGEDGSCRLVEGRVTLWSFQTGEKPYTREGGTWRLDASGTPVPVTGEAVRFVLAIPDAPVPASGWPLLLYAHGTGGDAYTFLGVARRLCPEGIAALGFDQPLHGARWPAGAMGDATILTFNIFNIGAMRDNIRQGAADLVSLAHWLRNLDVTPGDFPLGERFRIDPDRFLFFGHSQGSSTGVPYLAVRGWRHRAAVLSGASGGLILALLYKTAPLDIPLLVELGIGAYGELDRFHPVLTLWATFAEAADALNYGRYIQDESITPDLPWHPLHLFVSEGIYDRYTPPPLLEALATTISLAWADPELRPIEPFALLGRESQPRPIVGNLVRGGERYTSVLVQYPSGHFSLFDDPDGRREWFDFLVAAASGEVPEVAPP